jgi:hypothetical protein
LKSAPSIETLELIERWPEMTRPERSDSWMTVGVSRTKSGKLRPRAGRSEMERGSMVRLPAGSDWSIRPSSVRDRDLLAGHGLEVDGDAVGRAHAQDHVRPRAGREPGGVASST